MVSVAQRATWFCVVWVALLCISEAHAKQGEEVVWPVQPSPNVPHVLQSFGPFRTPAGVYGWGRSVVLSSTPGSAVVAALEGTVKGLGSSTVILGHKKGAESSFLGLQSHVNPKGKVNTGERIGTVASTGSCTLEFKESTAHVHPLRYLPYTNIAPPSLYIIPSITADTFVAVNVLVSTPTNEQDTSGVLITIYFLGNGQAPLELKYDFEQVVSSHEWSALAANPAAIPRIMVNPIPFNASSLTQAVEFVFNVSLPRANISSISIAAYDIDGRATVAAIDANGQPTAPAPIDLPDSSGGRSCPRPEPKPKDIWQCVNGQWRSSMELLSSIIYDVNSTEIVIGSPVVVHGDLVLRSGSSLQLSGLDGSLVISGCVTLSGKLTVLLSVDDVEQIKLNGTVYQVVAILSNQSCLQGQFDELVVEQDSSLSTACEGDLSYSPSYSAQSLIILFTPPPTCRIDLNEDSPSSNVWWVAIIIAGVVVVAVLSIIVLYVTVPQVRRMIRPNLFRRPTTPRAAQPVPL